MQSFPYPRVPYDRHASMTYPSSRVRAKLESFRRNRSRVPREKIKLEPRGLRHDRFDVVYIFFLSIVKTVRNFISSMQKGSWSDKKNPREQRKKTRSFVIQRSLRETSILRRTFAGSSSSRRCARTHVCKLSCLTRFLTAGSALFRNGPRPRK